MPASPQFFPFWAAFAIKPNPRTAFHSNSLCLQSRVWFLEWTHGWFCTFQHCASVWSPALISCLVTAVQFKPLRFPHTLLVLSILSQLLIYLHLASSYHCHSCLTTSLRRLLGLWSLLLPATSSSPVPAQLAPMENARRFGVMRGGGPHLSTDFTGLTSPL